MDKILEIYINSKEHKLYGVIKTNDLTIEEKIDLSYYVLEQCIKDNFDIRYINLTVSQKEKIEKMVINLREKVAFHKLMGKNMASIFYGVMLGEYFISEKYERILELNQSVNGAVSNYIDESYYKTFLLSPNVTYGELERTLTFGANGWLTKNGIYIPKTLEADNYFFDNSQKPYCVKKFFHHLYSYPQMDDTTTEFDYVISRGIFSQDDYSLIEKYKLSFFIGDVFSTLYPNYEFTRQKYILLLKELQKQLYNSKIVIEPSDCKLFETIALVRQW